MLLHRGEARGPVPEPCQRKAACCDIVQPAMASVHRTGGEAEIRLVRNLLCAATVGGEERNAACRHLDRYLRQVILPERRHDAEIHPLQYLIEYCVRIAVAEGDRTEAMGDGAQPMHRALVQICAAIVTERRPARDTGKVSKAFTRK
jgi:hypothetical protein